MSTFADWQPVYAEHNIPTFPVLGGVKTGGDRLLADGFAGQPSPRGEVWPF
jgi:hypothetical protein